MKTLPGDGGLGRYYSCPLPIEPCAANVTVFYEKRIRDLGWNSIEQHAAVTAWAKGNRIFLISRVGAEDIGLLPRARALKELPTPADAKFFFYIEVRPKPQG